MSDLKEQVFAVLKDKPLGDLTQKKVRRLLEESQGLNENDLDSKKDEIKQYVQEYVSQHSPAESEEEEQEEVKKPTGKRKKDESAKKSKKVKKEESEDEEDDSASDDEPKKKGKKTKKAANDEEPEKPKQLPITTRSGKEAPKGVKADQSNAMTGRQFVKNAENVEVNVFGNLVAGAPRSFTSNNRGWYAGGKIEVPIGKKTYWAQMSMNITILGSKDWEE